MKVRLVNENFTTDYVYNLLRARGISNPEEYRKPDETYLQSPLNLKNIEFAYVLYSRIVNNNGHILIIVDSDVDGYTSAVIIYQYTRRLNPDCHVDYWLHEGKEHGLNDHIDKLMKQNIHYDLIILPDSSSNDKTYHDMLDGINIPCLVLDHHITDVKLSDNAVIVNNQLSPNYTNKELTGAGIVYQFCRYLDEKTNHNWADDYIDLAALGIIGDMGSMINMENRYIACQGLKHISNSLFRTIVIKQSYSICGKVVETLREVTDDKLNCISVAFYVVPLMNALIRVGDMDEKDLLFQALIDGDKMVPCNKLGAKGTMATASSEAARVCTNAKAHQTKFLDGAMAGIERKINNQHLLDNRVLFITLDTENYPSELNGLIAMKCASKYKRPTIVARCNSKGFISGSARGLNQSALTDLKQFFTDSGFFEYASGHANAMGVSINKDNLTAFHAYANEQLKNIDFGENCYDVNFIRTAVDMDLGELIEDIGHSSNFWGQGMSEPLIYVTKIPLTEQNISFIGATKDTVKIQYCGMSYIKFKSRDVAQDLRQNCGCHKYINIVGRANLNEWCGRITPQLFIEDYEIVED